MAKYFINSGESYEVEASSEEEALALFHISQGHEDIGDYPQFRITEKMLDSVEYREANTIIEFVGL